MNAIQMRESRAYQLALESANNGDSVAGTLEVVMNDSLIRTQINSDKQGETLVSIALIVQQAQKDVRPIVAEYKHIN